MAINLLSKINERERKFIVLGGIAVFLIIVYYVYGLYADFKTQAEEYSETRVLMLEKQLAKLFDRESLEKRADEIKKEVARHEMLFLKGNKAPVAAAELQKTVKDIASSLSIEIRLERALNPVDEEFFMSVPVEIGFTSSTARLKSLLERLRATPFLINITEMQVRVLNVSKPEDINVTLVVSGYIKNPVEKKNGSKEDRNVS
jgi:Tfp pilus assembly protein PilO